MTSSLAQGRSCAKAAEVASQKVRPARSSAIQSVVRHPRAGGGAVPGEADVGVLADRREVGQRAVFRAQHPAVVELQLLGRVGRPALSEALPDQHVDRRAPRASTTSPSRRRRCRTPARCRRGSPRARRAGARCGRSPPSAAPSASPPGASGRGRRAPRPPRRSSRGAWRRDPRRTRDAPVGRTASGAPRASRRRGTGSSAISVVRAMFLSAPRSPSPGTRPRPA